MKKNYTNTSKPKFALFCTARPAPLHYQPSDDDVPTTARTYEVSQPSVWVRCIMQFNVFARPLPLALAVCYGVRLSENQTNGNTTRCAASLMSVWFGLVRNSHRNKSNYWMDVQHNEIQRPSSVRGVVVSSRCLPTYLSCGVGLAVD